MWESFKVRTRHLVKIQCFINLPPSSSSSPVLGLQDLWLMFILM